MTQLVRFEIADRIAVLTLDSQHNRNALGRELVAQLLDGMDRADASADVAAVLLGADGPAFCSGLDLKEAREGEMESSTRALVAVQRRLLASTKPVVVRIHGAVRAGGLGLVTAADIAIAADSVSFAFTEVRLGVAPAAISLTTLPRLTQRAAAEYWLTGATFSAEEAARIGLITRHVPDADLDDAVEDVLNALRQAEPQGLSETKRLLTAPLLKSIDDDGEELARRSAALFGSDAAQAAMSRFLGNRLRR